MFQFLHMGRQVINIKIFNNLFKENNMLLIKLYSINLKIKFSEFYYFINKLIKKFISFDILF